MDFQVGIVLSYEIRETFINCDPVSGGERVPNEGDSSFSWNDAVHIFYVVSKSRFIGGIVVSEPLLRGFCGYRGIGRIKNITEIYFKNKKNG
jgi:hypothetical protein